MSPSLGSLIEDSSRAEDRDLERTVVGSDVATEIAAIICEFVALAPEAFVVGAAAAEFCADWTRGAAPPSVNEMRAFVPEYEQTRGTRFDVSERDVIDAANLIYCAYLARCQHSDMRLGVTRGRSSSNGWMGLLRQREVGSPMFRGSFKRTDIGYGEPDGRVGANGEAE
jgi:hypothetical protein